MTNEQIAALILPWAKAEHPEKYDATLKVAGQPGTFRLYLLRLIEIRCTADPAWRTNVPLSLLEQTALTMTFRVKKLGVDIEVKGAKAPGPRVWSFTELASLMTENEEFFHTLVRAKSALDLELVPATNG